jgi:hypothetical protein
MKISDVEVSRHSEHSEYSLSWRSGDARYHVWLSTDGQYKVKPCIGNSNQNRALYKTTENGPAARATISQLDISVPKNKAMVLDAMAEATAQHLFEKCNADLLEHEQAYLKKAHAEYLIELQHKAGPEMYKVLKAIAVFFARNLSMPLAPGAMISETGDELIVDEVNRVVTLAEQGEGVPL